MHGVKDMQKPEHQVTATLVLVIEKKVTDMIKTMQKFSLTLLLFLAFADAAKSDEAITKNFLSNDGKYTVREIHHKIKDEWNNYAAIYDAKSDLELREIQFERSIDIVWAPSFSAFYLNDFCGSDETLAYVFVVGKSGVEKIDIKEKLLKNSKVTRFFGEHHRYIELEGWDGFRVRGVVKGYGYRWPKGFKQYFCIDLEKEIKSIFKKVNG